MTPSQAIGHLETLAANPIPAQEMSKAMFRFVRAAARSAQRAYPGMGGYYDPEFSGARADPHKYLFWPAGRAAMIPQSPSLQERLAGLPVVATEADPWSLSSDI
jgi:hypothetical protein